MAKNKTTETTSSVTDFLNTIDDENKRKDSFRLVEIFKEQTKCEAKMWGPSIVGFGSYHYKYDSGHEGDAPRAGFSPRTNAFALYLFLPQELRENSLAQLGKYKTGKSCLYIKKLADINEDILKEMVASGIDYMNSKYPQHFK